VESFISANCFTSDHQHSAFCLKFVYLFGYCVLFSTPK
jgi:hypothetical protein